MNNISTFNFQFYNYKLATAAPTTMGPSEASYISEVQMDIDDERMSKPCITSTPKPRSGSEIARPMPAPLQALRPQLHTPQKRWSMELREKVLEMSKRNNGSDGQEMTHGPKPQHQPSTAQEQQKDLDESEEQKPTPSVSDKINFFNKLTNTFEFMRPTATATGHYNSNNNNNNRFLSLLRSYRPTNIATTSTSNSNGIAIGQVPPPKPKRLSAMPVTGAQFSFATPTSMANNPVQCGIGQRKCSLRRKPSMDKSSRVTIARQNSNASMRPQRHAMMEDLSLVVPVRLRIAEYEKRISMSA